MLLGTLSGQIACTVKQCCATFCLTRSQWYEDVDAWWSDCCSRSKQSRMLGWYVECGSWGLLCVRSGLPWQACITHSHPNSLLLNISTRQDKANTMFCMPDVATHADRVTNYNQDIMTWPAPHKAMSSYLLANSTSCGFCISQSLFIISIIIMASILQCHILLCI